MITDQTQVRWGRPELFATAFISGAVVMALEILGSRLLAPVFGNSLFVWGALIGVILAAMSSGYALGGWLADRHPGGSVLAGLLLFSGAWTLLLAWAGQPVMFSVSAWIEDPRWGPCLAASILLAPPACGLSGVLPALLRLSIGDMGHLGRHTGAMIAVSTVGSLIGTWGTAFYLLTWLGSATMVAVLGIVQVVLGAFWIWRASAVGAKAGAPVLGGLAILLWLALHPGQALPEDLKKLIPPVPLHQEDSPYQQVRVRDDKEGLFRYLILDRTFHAVMWNADPVALFLPYSQLMMAALALPSEPKRGLILGHGGGSLAKWLARYWPDLELDTVEVDPSVVQAAERYFSYAPAKGHHVHVKDARMFLHSTTAAYAAYAAYDVIWVDVFARHMIPFHLTTQEFFREVRAHLHPAGVLAVNLSSSGEGPDRLRAQAVVATLKTVFPTIQSYGVKGPWKTVQQSKAENLIFFAGAPVDTMTPADFSTKVEALLAQNRLPVEARELLATRIEQDWPAGVVLTDDYAPYDLLIGRGAEPAPGQAPASSR
ncbi:MAG TPA: fused MFS/spermidine synthase [Nitrospiraceae bacterium]|nr:fused MFS/spermidine synthase [Nitrospiraceae bacterium]